MSSARGPDGLFATRIRQIAQIHVDETRAEELWREVSRHRRAMAGRLGRDVGQRVALLDYLDNYAVDVPESLLADRASAQAHEQRAITDALTGLYNHYFFELELHRETERSIRYGTPCSLMALALDDGAEAAARYGRPVLDEVIQAVAALLLHHVRAPDVPCRTGTETFMVLLPGTAQADALVVAERICTDVSQWFRRHRVGALTVDASLSAGVSTWRARETGSPSRLVEEAEAALQEAQLLGGDRASALLAGVGA